MLALVVVKALVGSPWGTFTVFCTIPIALLMGVYSRFIRPGRIARDVGDRRRAAAGGAGLRQDRVARRRRWRRWFNLQRRARWR